MAITVIVDLTAAELAQVTAQVQAELEPSTNLVTLFEDNLD